MVNGSTAADTSSSECDSAGPITPLPQTNTTPPHNNVSALNAAQSDPPPPPSSQQDHSHDSGSPPQPQIPGAEHKEKFRFGDCCEGWLCLLSLATGGIPWLLYMAYKTPSYVKRKREEKKVRKELAERRRKAKEESEKLAQQNETERGPQEGQMRRQYQDDRLNFLAHLAGNSPQQPTTTSWSQSQLAQSIASGQCGTTPSTSTPSGERTSATQSQCPRSSHRAGTDTTPMSYTPSATPVPSFRITQASPRNSAERDTLISSPNVQRK